MLTTRPSRPEAMSRRIETFSPRESGGAAPSRRCSAGRARSIYRSRYRSRGGLRVCSSNARAPTGTSSISSSPAGGRRYGTCSAGVVMEDRPKLLIVDDDVHIRRLLKLLLRGSGYELFEAATGEEAV